MKLLISHSWGAPSSCYYHPDVPATMVIHDKFQPLDLRDLYRAHGESEFPRTQQQVMRKLHPKQCEQRFLCTSCYRTDYLNNPMRYDIESGLADFTSIEMQIWRDKNYQTVEEAAQRFIKKEKGK